MVVVQVSEAMVKATFSARRRETGRHPVRVLPDYTYDFSKNKLSLCSYWEGKDWEGKLG